MIVVMHEGAEEASVEAVISHLVAAGCDVHRSSGAATTILGVVGGVSEDERTLLGQLPGVAQVVRVTAPYRRASRRFRPHPTVVEGDWGRIGGSRPWVAIEAIGLPAVSEDADERPPSLPYVIASGRPFDAAVSRLREPPDQIGALACLALNPAARTSCWPITFVRRDPVWSPEEWLVAAERELDAGASSVVLVEGGGRQTTGPRTLDVVALVATTALTHLPIVVDVPSIASRASDVEPIASAAVAAGAAGVVLRGALAATGRVALQPAALPWESAVELANRLRRIGEALGE